MRDELLPVRVSYAWEEINEEQPWLQRAAVNGPVEVYTDGSSNAGHVLCCKI